VARLLAEPSFSDRAAQLQDQMLSMPTPSELVGPLEELAVKHRTR
jgi:hypothetical protein